MDMREMLSDIVLKMAHNACMLAMKRMQMGIEGLMEAHIEL